MENKRHLIVDFAYYINTSDAYKQFKQFFYNFLENDDYKYKKYFDMIMIIFIFASVIILIREVKSHVNDFWLFFNNYILSIIFLIEYILRLWVNSSVTEIIIKQNEKDSMFNRQFNVSLAFLEIFKVKILYMFTIRAIIDLLAIIPFFHQLRLLRIFILFRVFKLFRYARSFQIFTSVFSAKKFEFLTLLIFASVVIFVSSVLIYVMEANNPESPIDTLFEAVYWSIVTISTVGYGDVTPITTSGRVVSMVVITSGLAVIAFTTSIVVSALTEKLDEIREIRTIENIEKLKQFYLICGYESIAKEVVKMLSKDKNIIVLDENQDRVNEAIKDGLVALNFDPGSVESYKKLHIDINTQIKAILCLRECDIENVYTAMTVRSINKDVFILSILMSDIHKNKLLFAGVNEVLYTRELVGMITREFVGKPVAFEVIHALRTDYSSVDIHEIFVSERIANNFALVSQVDNIKYRVVMLGIYKQKNKRFLFNPIDSTVIEEGDYLLVVGNITFVKEFEKYLNKKAVHI